MVVILEWLKSQHFPANSHGCQWFICCCNISYVIPTTPNALCVAVIFPYIILMIPNALCVVAIFSSGIPITPNAICFVVILTSVITMAPNATRVVVIFTSAYEGLVALFLSLAFSFPILSPLSKVLLFSLVPSLAFSPEKSHTAMDLRSHILQNPMVRFIN